MTPATTLGGAVWGVPAAVALLAAVVLWAPVWTQRRHEGWRLSAVLTVLLAIAAGGGDGVVAFALLGAASALQGASLRRVAPTASALLIASAFGAVLTSLALGLDRDVLAFWSSVVTIVLRIGLYPAHGGTSELAERAPALLAPVAAVSVVTIFVHLRFNDHVGIAFDAAPLLVRYGAAMTLIPALMSLVQRDLRGFLRNAAVMHGGMVLAAVGAAGRGHAAAALMVVLTTAFAVGGLGLTVAALEARVGAVALPGPGGRVQGFPRLAAAFALFAAAGVAMPGTAGFIADDLMLHALWGESVASTVMMILGAAALAIASLATYAKVFLGPATPSLAPDLLARERGTVTAFVLVLLALGFAPGVLLTPADSFFALLEPPR